MGATDFNHEAGSTLEFERAAQSTTFGSDHSTSTARGKRSLNLVDVEAVGDDFDFSLPLRLIVSKLRDMRRFRTGK
jgi:hypothetical protein